MQHLLCSLTHTHYLQETQNFVLCPFPPFLNVAMMLKKKKRTNLSKLAGITYQTGQIHMNI